MNLPSVIKEFVKTKNSFDSFAFAECFSETAVVFDEGKTHTGKKEIEQWIDNSNKQHQDTLEPIDYDKKEDILSAKVTGTFPQSPIVLKFHFIITDGKIRNLKVTE
ncbi:nuclear transport factor 2 family protein [Epilithonimonas sp.]|uniref:nuclear transport factor 2 family protein n=1 Tax=Epilithonimonas sp. TaxID=2894511 RepID=UPI0028992150|nr:nuclear transport factor 2 family protein [Epilithonimonas sp.]